MPRALFTPTKREDLTIAADFPMATQVSRSDDEDVFEIGPCRIWTRGGDFVSKQILGCHNAVRTGRLQCTNADLAKRQVSETQSVIGMVGPDETVFAVALALGARYGGV